MVHGVRLSQKGLIGRSHFVIGVLFTDKIGNRESELLKSFNLNTDNVCLLFYL